MALPANPQVTACSPPPWVGSLGYRLPMQVRRFDDITAFREVAAVSGARRGSAQPHPRDASTLMQKPDLHPVFDLWVASDGDEVTGAALRTPPFNWSSPSPRTIPLSMRSSTG